MGQPVCWEEVLLSCVALPDAKEPEKEKAATCVGNLLSFDSYGRSADMAKGQPSSFVNHRAKRAQSGIT